MFVFVRLCLCVCGGDGSDERGEVCFFVNIFKILILLDIPHILLLELREKSILDLIAVTYIYSSALGTVSVPGYHIYDHFGPHYRAVKIK